MSARKQLRGPLATKQLELRMPSVDVDLQIAHDDLVEVLVIILDNAIKYSPKGGAIEIKCLVHGDEVLIAVQDHGPGIDPSDLPYIFDRFYRSKLRPDHTAGHGIGLAVARKLVLASGGTITADSRPKNGASFTIKLRTMRPSV